MTKKSQRLSSTKSPLSPAIFHAWHEKTMLVLYRGVVAVTAVHMHVGSA